MRRLVQESKKISLLPSWVHKEFDELLIYCYCSKSQKPKTKTEKLQEKTNKPNTKFTLYLATDSSWSFFFYSTFYCIYPEFSVKSQRKKRGFLYLQLPHNYRLLLFKICVLHRLWLRKLLGVFCLLHNWSPNHTTVSQTGQNSNKFSFLVKELVRVCCILTWAD